MSIKTFFLSSILAGALVLNGCVSAAVSGVTTGGVWAAQERSFGNAIDDAGILLSINSKYVQKQFDNLFRAVNIKVHEGRVLLTGQVISEENKKEAEKLAWEVSGVREVINELQVNDKLSLKEYATDAWINTEIAARLIASKHVNSVNYSVNTVNGVVYVIGIAKDRNELDSVAKIISKIKGVKRVIGHVRLKNDPLRNNVTLKS